MGYITGEDRNQIILFPESIDEYVSDNNSIRIIDEYIKQLNHRLPRLYRRGTHLNRLLSVPVYRELALIPNLTDGEFPLH